MSGGTPGHRSPAPIAGHSPDCRTQPRSATGADRGERPPRIRDARGRKKKKGPRSPLQGTLQGLAVRNQSARGRLDRRPTANVRYRPVFWHSFAGMLSGGNSLQVSKLNKPWSPPGNPGAPMVGQASGSEHRQRFPVFCRSAPLRRVAKTPASGYKLAGIDRAPTRLARFGGKSGITGKLT